MSRESFAVSITKPKIAALLYDRVWSGLQQLGIPDSISFHAFDEFEHEYIVRKNVGVSRDEDGNLLIYDRRTGEAISHQGIEGFIESSGLMLLELMIAANREVFDKLKHKGGINDSVKVRAEQKFCSLLSSEYGIHAVPIFESLRVRDQTYKEGDYGVIIPILENIPVVDDTQIEWEQIIEFRNDANSRKHLIRLHHWLDKEMVGRTERFILDDIQIRLENYELALKKHGLKTICGIISSTLDYRTLISGVITPIIMSKFLDSIYSILTGTAVILGHATVKAISARLDLKDTQCGPNSEVAFVHEVKSNLSK